MPPPLRAKEHLEKIWRGLWRGDLSAVSTDHCPFCYEEQPHGLKFSKRQGEREGFHKIPNGGPGIEHRIPVFFDGAVKKRGMTPSRGAASSSWSRPIRPSCSVSIQRRAR